MDVDKLIRSKLRVKRGDSLPYTGWYKATRLDLVAILAEVGYTKGAEIGVAQGTFSEILCQSIPNLDLTCIDPWMAYGRCKQGLCDRRYDLAVTLLGKYPGAHIVRKSSLEASQEVPDGSLDFVYIDGDHRFDAVMLDLILWAPKVRRGGMVCGHDYYHFYQAGVCWAVDAYTRAHNVTAWYLTKEKEASYMWVKRG